MNNKNGSNVIFEPGLGDSLLVWEKVVLGYDEITKNTFASLVKSMSAKKLSNKTTKSVFIRLVFRLIAGCVLFTHSRHGHLLISPGDYILFICPVLGVTILDA